MKKIVIILYFLFFTLPVASLHAETTVIMKVLEEGIYSLKGNDLAKLGIKLPVSADNMQVKNRGRDIQIDMANVIDGNFDYESSITFFGNGIAKNDPAYKYTISNPYILVIGGERGRFMATRQVAPPNKTHNIVETFTETIHAEEDLTYPQLQVGELEERWFWGDKLSIGQVREYSIQLPYASENDNTCNIRVKVYGKTDSLHEAEISLNNQIIKTVYWSGKGFHLIDIKDITSCPVISEEKAGTHNEFKIYLPQTLHPNTIFIDWVEIDYNRLLITSSNRLKFSSTNATENRFTLKNFTGQLAFFDITDLKNGNISKIEKFKQADKAPNLRDLEFSENLKTPRIYYAVSDAGIRKPVLEAYSLANLKNPENQADYIIITPQKFLTDINPFIEHRTKFSNLKILTAELTDIYDEFDEGLESPQAIRNFLEYAYNNWADPKPRFVLLVGDASIDPKHNMKDGFAGIIPTRLINTTSTNNDLKDWEVPTDNWFAAFSNGSPVPVLAIGRFPVKTKEELNIVIDKTIKFDLSTKDVYNKNLLLIADDAKLDSVYTSSDSDIFTIPPVITEEFNIHAEKLSGFIQNEKERKKIYLTDYIATIDPADKNEIQIESLAAEKANADIMSSLNYGVWMTLYTGHGSIDYWAAGQMFKSTGVQLLDEDSPLTLVTSFDCLNGYIISPRDDTYDPVSMAEAFLLAPKRGAAAAWMPTAIGHPSEHEILSTGLLKAIFEDKTKTVGEAILSAKTYAFENNISSDPLDIFTLFGDPALKIDSGPPLKPDTVDDPGAGAPPVEEEGGRKKKKSGGCFIATAAYGSGLDKHVILLSEFRDRYLLTNRPGRLFTSLYYRFSPPAADYIAQNEPLKFAVRTGLIPLILLSYFMIKLSTAAQILTLAILTCIVLVIIKGRQYSIRDYHEK